MTSPAEKVESIRSQLPQGMSLPAEFSAFVALVSGKDGHDAMNVAWSDACFLLNADEAARDSFVPFLLLSDGGVVALWADGAEQRVAYCDSEGQFGILAENFSDFLAVLGQADAALLEQLELDAPIDTSRLTPPREPAPVSGDVEQAFRQWVESHSLSAGPTRSPAGDAAREALYAIAKRMLQDGLSKVHKPTATRWKFSLRLTDQGKDWSVEYRDYGVWYPLPETYGFAELLPALLGLMKTRVSSYELTIDEDGMVFADGGNQLALMPADAGV